MDRQDSRVVGRDFAVSDGATIAVVIPTFNSVATIRRALTSVRQQTLAPSKTIVVDNASTDATCDEVEEVSMIWPELNLNLIRLDANVGPGAARNIGWQNSGTSLIAFLDSDDSWHPQKLELQHAVVAAHPHAVLFGHKYLVRGDSSQIDVIGHAQRYRSHQYSLWHFLIRNRLSTPTVMVRADIPQRFPTDTWYAEDFSLWTNIVAQNGPAVFSDAVLTYLHKPVYGSSGLSVHDREMHRGELKVLSELRSAEHIGTVAYFMTQLWMRMKYVRRRIRRVAT
jgi:glycosyltransferase involved in cell wall biosynthesis